MGVRLRTLGMRRTLRMRMRRNIKLGRTLEMRFVFYNHGSKAEEDPGSEDEEDPGNEASE